MIKKLMLAVAALVLTMGAAFAQVDVNKADAAALDSVKGIGPAMSKVILEERSKGEFKDWPDLQKRVKGMGDKRAMKLSEAGLVVSGKPKDGAQLAKPATAKAAPAKAAPAKAKGAEAKPVPAPAKM